MRILYVQCGLGNQMFQYAYLRHLEKSGRSDIWIDSSAPSLRKHAGFELRTIFPAINSRGRFMPYFAGRTLHLLSDVLKKGFGYNLETEGDDKLWLRGYWQDSRFAESVRDELLEDFRFSPITDPENMEMAARIASCCSVSMHIRRGDYIKPETRSVFGDVCTPEYYNKAIEFIRERVSDPVFFIFSDDVRWVAENFDLQGAVFVNHNSGAGSFRDMQLMSLCRHNIIANSSFSWWGAWLNVNADKIVVAPPKWFNNYPDEFNRSIVPADWNRVGAPTPNLSLVADFEIDEKDFNNIMAQSYFDFELVTPQNPSQPRGNHVFNLTQSEMSGFANKKYLEQKLKTYFISISE